MLNALNEEQRIAVLEEGNVLLNACPGSGKTRTLTYKLAYELANLNDSKTKVIAVTYTNRAADEIKKRIRDLITADSNLWAGTIHAFCLEWIIRPYMCYLDDLKNGFAVADEHHVEELITTLKEKHELKNWININTRYLPNGELEEDSNKALVNEYHGILKDRKLIDFDQILYFSFRLIQEFELIPEILKNLFRIVCIDEYQDTPLLQYSIFAKIMRAKSGKCKMFIVGDADQAIYSSLGGVAKTIDEIKHEFGCEFKSLKLSGNYRSNQQIINFYKNFQTSDIDILAVGKNHAEEAIITYNKTISKEDVGRYIANIIQAKIKDGIDENDICVLAPTWYMVAPMGRHLRALLPELKFDAIGLSPLLKNRENIWFKIARLFLVSSTPKTFILRRRWAAELLTEFSDIGISVLEDLEYPAKELLKTVNSIQSTKEDGLEYLEECFITLNERLGIDKNGNAYLKTHWDSYFEGARKRLSNPDFNLAHDIESFKKMFHHERGVVVNTCHGIKGEEYDTVIAFGLLQGRLPNWNEKSETAAAKLLYVICSRSRRELHLISERGWTTNSRSPYLPTEVLDSVVYKYN